MAANAHCPGLSVAELEYIQRAVVVGGAPAAVYPDEAFCQYVKAAVVAGHANVPGAPSVAVAQAVRAAIGT